MKKIGCILLGLLVASSALAALDAYENNNVYSIVAPRSVATDGGYTSTPVAVKQTVKGRALVLLYLYGLGTGANHGATVKLQHASASNGTFSDVSGMTYSITGTNAGSVTSFDLDTQVLSNYVRAVVWSTNSADVVGAIIVGPKAR